MGTVKSWGTGSSCCLTWVVLCINTVPRFLWNSGCFSDLEELEEHTVSVGSVGNELHRNFKQIMDIRFSVSYPWFPPSLLLCFRLIGICLSALSTFIFSSSGFGSYFSHYELEKRLYPHVSQGDFCTSNAGLMLASISPESSCVRMFDLKWVCDRTALQTVLHWWLMMDAERNGQSGHLAWVK